MNVQKLFLLLLIAPLAQIGHGEEAGKTEAAPLLPKVLLLGDSISMGYHDPVVENLKGVADVTRPDANCGPTTNGVAKIDQWLGDTDWAVIHFNFGLHDLKYMDEAGRLVLVEQGRQQVSLEDYEANLRKIVKRLKETGAELVFATTTPVPEGSYGRVKGDDLKYNAIAFKVMKEEKIPVNDLHAHAFKKLDKIQRPKNVHFTPEGSAYLGEKVAQEVKAALARRAAE